MSARRSLCVSLDAQQPRFFFKYSISTDAILLAKRWIAAPTVAPTAVAINTSHPIVGVKRSVNDLMSSS